MKGKQPLTGNMLVEDHLRPAAVLAGVLDKHDTKRRFGYHNLRHSLATFLVASGKDPKTVQSLLRHSDVAVTLGIYAHSHDESRLAAQKDLLAAFFAPSGMGQSIQ
jgi:site-specific recombinase XerD